MTDFINTILTICGVGVACCCSLFIGIFFVLLSRGRIMMFPVVISLGYNFLASLLDGSFSLFNRSRMDDPLPPTGRTNLRSRADELKQRHDPLAVDDDFDSQSARRRPSSGDSSRSQSSIGRPRPSPGGSSSSSGGSGLSPAPRPNLPRRGASSDTGSLRRPVDEDDMDSPRPPRLRDRRESQRRRNRNDYDDEVMGGIFGDEDDDGWI